MDDLPEDVTSSAESVTTFRRLLKTHLFRESFPDYLLDINSVSVDLAVVLLLRPHKNILIDWSIDSPSLLMTLCDNSMGQMTEKYPRIYPQCSLRLISTHGYIHGFIHGYPYPRQPWSPPTQFGVARSWDLQPTKQNILQQTATVMQSRSDQ